MPVLLAVNSLFPHWFPTHLVEEDFWWRRGKYSLTCSSANGSAWFLDFEIWEFWVLRAAQWTCPWHVGVWFPAAPAFFSLGLRLYEYNGTSTNGRKPSVAKKGQSCGDLGSCIPSTSSQLSHRKSSCILGKVTTSYWDCRSPSLPLGDLLNHLAFWEYIGDHFLEKGCS